MKLLQGLLVVMLAANAAEALDVVKKTGVDGGIFVRIGCDDPDALMAMKADNCIVQGLDTDEHKVQAARAAIAAQGGYGPISATVFDGKSLPYISDTINLLVADHPGELSRSEILRVLCPQGVAIVKGQRIVKPLPGNTAPWGHFLYDASGNAVSPDTAVDVPYHIQWVGGPKWARSHDRLSSLNSLVSSDGKLFYIFDEGRTEDFYYPAQWKLICRDAYNGVILWKRDISRWEDHWRAFRSGPNQLNRRIVAVGDRIYTAPGLGEPVEVLDAATGKTIRMLKGTEGTEEIIEKDGILYLIILPYTGEPTDYQSRFRHKARPGLQKKVMAVDPASGTVLWDKQDRDTLGILPVTLIADRDKVYFQSRNTIIALDKKTGQQRWKSLRRSAISRPSNFSPALLVYKDVVISVDNLPKPVRGQAEGVEESLREQDNIAWTFSASASRIKGELVAFSAQTGQALWTTDAMAAYGAQMDCFAVDDLVYVGQTERRHTTDFTKGYDVHTGEIKNELDTRSAFTKTHHHRCWRNKATCRYILMGRTGVELISFDGELAMQNAFTRGNCEYGIMPANGLIYVPPHACGCYIQVKVSGFFAYSSKGKEPLAGQVPQNLLIKGQAYDRISHTPSAVGAADWPTYRADALRSGATASAVDASLEKVWRVKLPGRITSPVVAGDTVYAASQEAHTLYALDRRNGSIRWTFRAGARIDSPPSVAGNTLYVGSRDGWVYALLRESGKLAWKFRAAKSERKHCVYGQLESVWPVHGSVLFLDGSLFFAAGRSSYLDDGLTLYQLDAKTGQTRMEKRIYSRDPVTGDQVDNAGHDLPGALNDLLASDGKTLFLRDFQWHLADPPAGNTIKGVLPQEMKAHVHNTAGYLDGTWAHRTYWYYGTKMNSGYGGWPRTGRKTYSGRIMVRDDRNLYGYGRQILNNDFHAAPALGVYAQRDLHLYRAPLAEPVVSVQKAKGKAARKKPRRSEVVKFDYAWSQACQVHVRAMALSGTKVLVAGTRDILKANAMTRQTIAKQARLLAGTEEQHLEIYAKQDGAQLARYTLPARPVFDGMAVAQGHVFIATEGDELLCFGPRQ